MRDPERKNQRFVVYTTSLGGLTNHLRKNHPGQTLIQTVSIVVARVREGHVIQKEMDTVMDVLRVMPLTRE
jgi:hypothetical protein